MAYDILHSLAFVDNQNIAWAVIAKTVMMVERTSQIENAGVLGPYLWI